MKLGALFSILARALVGGAFLYSGWEKLVMPIEEFERQVEQYQMFPSLLIPWIARTVPWVELIFGAFVFTGFMRRMSARILGALTFGFIGLLSVTLMRGIDPGDCGCFGAGVHLSVSQALLLDSCLASALIFLSFYRHRYLELDQWLDPDCPR